jgi:hypothetical protein
MPKRTPKKDPDLYKKEEIKIKDAYNYYLQYPEQKIAKVAREFDVPYRRLLARVNGQTTLQERSTQNRILTDDQERAIKAWLDDIDLMGIPPTNRMIISCANAILQGANPHVNPPPTVGTGWVYRFTKRLPGYKRVKQKPIDPKRLEAEDLGVIQTWFDRLEIQLRTKHITPSNI